MLSLRHITNSNVDLIFDDETYIGLIGRKPVATAAGLQPPKIVLDSIQTEQTLERIKNLINKARGTNADIGVIKPPPRYNDPRILDYMRRRHGDYF